MLSLSLCYRTSFGTLVSIQRKLIIYIQMLFATLTSIIQRGCLYLVQVHPHNNVRVF